MEDPMIFYLPNGCSRVQHDDGSTFYFDKNSYYHCEDGPAFHAINYCKCWYIHGKPHRLNGPAIEYNDGRKEWFINGKQYNEEDYSVVVQYLWMIE